MGPMMLNFLGTTLISGSAVPQVVSAANPLPVTLSGGIGGLAVAGTIAAGAAVGGQFPVTVGGVDGGGLARQLLTDATGVLQVNATIAGGNVVTQGPGNTASPWAVQGNVASGVADGGNPVKAGGVFNSTRPTLASGNRGDLQLTTQGNLIVNLGGATTSTLVNVATAGSDAVGSGGQGTQGLSFGYVFNGSTFDRVREPTADASAVTGLVAAPGMTFNGSTWDRTAKPRTAFRLPSSAASNNAANIKASPGTVYSIAGNVTLAGSTCYLKFFDTTAVPNPAAATPLYMFALNIVDGAISFNLPAGGLYFPTGIGVAIVGGAADLDNTAIAAGQVTALNVAFA